jgi:hypothetical protein
MGKLDTLLLDLLLDGVRSWQWCTCRVNGASIGLASTDIASHHGVEGVRGP